MADIASTLPEGVVLRRLAVHADDRGRLSELYREAWTTEAAFQQWNLVRSEARVLRGVHVHPRHSDYLHVIEGEMWLGLHDLRPDDPARRMSCIVMLGGETPCTVFVPPGVCHGFWFPTPSTYIYGLSTGWSMDEELGCRYDDPALGLDWKVDDPLLSPRDQAPATDYTAMREAWLAARGAA